MSEVKVIQINESVFAQNDRAAELIRKKLTEQGTLFLNFMSSPGSGKTTTLVALINRLKDRLNIGEMDVDIETSLDAQHVADRTGIRSLQIHNGGLCHIDADVDLEHLVALVKGRSVTHENLLDIVGMNTLEHGVKLDVLLLVVEPWGIQRRYPEAYLVLRDIPFPNVCFTIVEERLEFVEQFGHQFTRKRSMPSFR